MGKSYDAELAEKQAPRHLLDDEEPEQEDDDVWLDSDTGRPLLGMNEYVDTDEMSADDEYLDAFDPDRSLLRDSDERERLAEHQTELELDGTEVVEVVRKQSE